MRAVITGILLAVSMTIAPATVLAQLNATGPVVNGHHHINVSDADAHMRFWVDTLGGKAGTFGNGTPIAMFPDALVFLREQAPTGPTIGSIVDHVGFSVPDLRAMVDRLSAAGYRLITAQESAPDAQIVDGIRVVPGGGPVTGVAYVLGPDDIKVEVLERRSQDAPIVSDHIHFFSDDAQQMREWYAVMFGATPRPTPGPGFISSDLPGLALNFTQTENSTAGTPGRVLDHIGFEVADLAALVAELEAKGVEFDVPYREIPEIGLALAFVSDPWGTSIELTEGLDNIR